MDHFSVCIEQMLVSMIFFSFGDASLPFETPTAKSTGEQSCILPAEPSLFLTSPNLSSGSFAILCFTSTIFFLTPFFSSSLKSPQIFNKLWKHRGNYSEKEQTDSLNHCFNRFPHFSNPPTVNERVQCGIKIN